MAKRHPQSCARLLDQALWDVLQAFASRNAQGKGSRGLLESPQKAASFLHQKHPQANCRWETDQSILCVVVTAHLVFPAPKEA